MELVKDVMVREVVTVSPFASLRDALMLMKKHQVKSLVVERRSLHDSYGMLSYAHILRTIVAEDGDIDLINVYDAAFTPVISVSEELAVKHAAALMSRYHTNRIVVSRDNEMTGLVTMNDIVAKLMDAMD